MNHYFLLLASAVIGLITGVLLIIRPRWFRNLPKIRWSYIGVEEKNGDLFNTIWGIIFILLNLMLIIKVLIMMFQ